MQLLGGVGERKNQGGGGQVLDAKCTAAFTHACTLCIPYNALNSLKYQSWGQHNGMSREEK
jgi:hypothetical protein